MSYTFFVGNTPIFMGTVYELIIVIGLLIALNIIIVRIGIRKIRENQVIQHQFISIIAHKFRTPLTQVKWLVEAVLAHEVDPYRKKDLNDISQSNDKLINLMQVLISLTNSDKENEETAPAEKIFIVNFVRNIGEHLKPLFQEKNISFAVQSQNPELVVNANPTELAFAVQSVLYNSCVYSHPGQQVDVFIIKKWRSIQIIVQDRGIGIDINEQKKVFDQFHRGANAEKMDTEGLGVSLFLSRSIMKRYKGKIRITSPGIEQGTTCTLILPRKNS